jgi:DNA-binding MarR family transcriptional regulator
MTRPLVPYKEASRLLFNIPVIRLASRLSTLVQRDVLEPSGLKTAEWRILFNLVVTGDTHLRQIARYSSTDASYVSRILARLEKEGLVSRYADARDGRRTRFSATAKGKALIDALLPEVTDLSEGFRALFTEEELALFQSMLERAIDHANELIETPGT